MQTLEALSRRIASTEDLRSIVRTMKSLSAVSIRQYERAVSSLDGYARTVELGLRVVLRGRRAPPGAARDEEGPVAAVIIGSDHGLCGRFNDEVARVARETLRRVRGQRGPLILAVGARVGSRLAAQGEAVRARLPLPGSVDGLTATAEEILVAIDRWRTDLGVTRALVFHNRRTAGSTASPHAAPLLPVDLDRLSAEAAGPWPSRTLPTFTMDAERLFGALIREHLFVTAFRAGAESLASEHASRLAAMQAAERNIEERLDELRAELHRRRQQAITEELLDVIAGFLASRPDGGEGDASGTP